MSVETEMIRRMSDLEKRLSRFEAGEFATTQWEYLTAPLTSTSWDGDSFSTTAKTLIDLSAVFGAPAGITAVLICVRARDSAAATSDAVVILSPNDTALSGAQHRITGGFNDYNYSVMWVVPCNSDGDIFYQTIATGAGTLDIILEIWGYAREK